MLTTSIIAYNHNTFLKPNLGLGYPQVNLMLHQMQQETSWRGSIHPREIENAWVDASERAAKLCQYEIDSGRRVVILGGDISGLGIFTCLIKEMPHLQFECLDANLETLWNETIVPLKPDWNFLKYNEASSMCILKCCSASELSVDLIQSDKIKCLYLYDVNPTNQQLVTNELMKVFK